MADGATKQDLPALDRDPVVAGSSRSLQQTAFNALQ